MLFMLKNIKFILHNIIKIAEELIVSLNLTKIM